MVRKILVAAAVPVAALACRADRPEAGPATDLETAAPRLRPAVLVLGTSLTAGLGVAPEEAYPALLQHKIDSAGLDYEIVNAGESGGTSAGGVRRIDWLLHRPVAVLVLELGANDGLRGQDVAALEHNLQEIVDRTRAVHPDVAIVVVGMEAPPNMGARYTAAFRAVFRELSETNDALLVPFLLDGVGGRPEFNQADGIHPNPAGHRRMADNVWRVLQGVL